MNFDPQQDYLLEDELVSLVPLHPGAEEALLHFVKSQPDLWKYSPYRPDTEEAFRNYFAKAQQAREAGTQYPYVIFDKRSGQWAGSSRLYDISLEHQTVVIGYTWYGREFQGTGLNKHCKFLLLQQAFEHWGFHRVEFVADERNERSVNALKSIGCTQEGILRAHFLMPEGHRRNSVVMSILQPEWQSHVKQLLMNKIT